MKVVINRCFGGYSLSPEALLRLHELGSIAVGTELKDVDNGSSEDSDYPITPDKKYYIYPNSYISTEIRTCPLLVKIVEEMGAKANGRYSELGVVETPDNISWYIDDYKGIESVHEEHEIWN